MSWKNRYIFVHEILQLKGPIPVSCLGCGEILEEPCVSRRKQQMFREDIGKIRAESAQSFKGTLV